MSKLNASEENQLKRNLLARVKRLRAYYINIVIFVIFSLVYAFCQYYPLSNRNWVYWGLVFWGMLLIAQGVNLYDGFWIFSKHWEEKKVQELFDKEIENRDLS